VPNPTTIRFNPTATAFYYDGTSADETRNEINRLAGKSYIGGLAANRYYVVFMGEVYVMDENQFRAAQGLV
jgi:hypothetical protein